MTEFFFDVRPAPPVRYRTGAGSCMNGPTEAAP